MASHASAKKSVRKSERQRIVNRNRIGRIRTCIKKLAGEIAGNVSADTIAESLRTAQSEVMRGVSKRVVHKNTAARIISKWTRKVKSVMDSAAVEK
jgi:small subunit ribosomal protein S20